MYFIIKARSCVCVCGTISADDDDEFVEYYMYLYDREFCVLK